MVFSIDLGPVPRAVPEDFDCSSAELPRTTLAPRSNENVDDMLIEYVQSLQPKTPGPRMLMPPVGVITDEARRMVEDQNCLARFTQDELFYRHRVLEQPMFDDIKSQFKGIKVGDYKLGETTHIRDLVAKKDWRSITLPIIVSSLYCSVISHLWYEYRRTPFETRAENCRVWFDAMTARIAMGMKAYAYGIPETESHLKLVLDSALLSSVVFVRVAVLIRIEFHKFDDLCPQPLPDMEAVMRFWDHVADLRTKTVQALAAARGDPATTSIDVEAITQRIIDEDRRARGSQQAAARQNSPPTADGLGALPHPPTPVSAVLPSSALQTPNVAQPGDSVL